MSKQEKPKKDRKKTNQATASRLSVGRGGAVREKDKNRLKEHFYNSSKHRCDSSKVMHVGFFPSLPFPLQPSSSLQMFTVLSIDPVAISGEVGEKADDVTYLQQRITT